MLDHAQQLFGAPITESRHVVLHQSLAENARIGFAVGDNSIEEAGRNRSGPEGRESLSILS